MCVLLGSANPPVSRSSAFVFKRVLCCASAAVALPSHFISFLYHSTTTNSDVTSIFVPPPFRSAVLSPCLSLSLYSVQSITRAIKHIAHRLDSAAPAPDPPPLPTGAHLPKVRRRAVWAASAAAGHAPAAPLAATAAAGALPASQRTQRRLLGRPLSC